MILLKDYNILFLENIYLIIYNVNSLFLFIGIIIFIYNKYIYLKYIKDIAYKIIYFSY